MDPQPGRMRLKEVENAQANLGRSTVAILWAAFRDIPVVAFDARRTAIMPEGLCRHPAERQQTSCQNVCYAKYYLVKILLPFRKE